MRYSEYLYHLECQWEARDRFSVVRKMIRGKQYYYAQWYEEGVQRRKGIPHDKVEGMLQRVERKKKLRDERRAARKQLAEMPKEERKGIRAELKLLQIMYKGTDKVGVPGEQTDRHCFDREKPWKTPPPERGLLRGLLITDRPVNRDLDGDTRDSKSELILTLLMRVLRCEGTYNVPINTRKTVRVPDFTFDRNGFPLFWEHMGMLSDRNYRARQREKLSEYRDIGVTVGKNLMITVDHAPPDGGPGCIDLPEVAWRMVRNGLVSASAVVRIIRRIQRVKTEQRICMAGF